MGEAFIEEEDIRNVILMPIGGPTIPQYSLISLVFLSFSSFLSDPGVRSMGPVLSHSQSSAFA